MCGERWSSWYRKMSGVLTGRVAKKRSCPPRSQVLRMMAIMQDGNSGEVPKEFLETGRTGRRNAMPDILSPPDAHASTADLPARLQELATSGESKCETSDLVSVQSQKCCCKNKSLNEILCSECAKQRNAISTPSANCDPATCDCKLEDPETDKYQISKLDLENLDKMLANSTLCDPKNPQPGPSHQPGPPPGQDDAQKASGS